MIKRILSISGRPGLYSLVNQGKNMLIVESLTTGKRSPAYAHDKVISLGDVAIYTNDEDVPLADVLTSVSKDNDGKPVDLKQFANDAALREYFGKILPDFDQDRVYNTDIRKVFTWYNQLIAAGITQFKDDEAAQDQAVEASETAENAEA